MSWLSKGIKSVINPILNLGSKEGPKNPFAAPDASALTDTSKYDFLKGDTWKTDTTKTDNSFSSWLSSISGVGSPSSVDAVRSEINSEAMTNLLNEIDKSTNQAVGSTKMDFEERGLGGPGMISSMEAVGLGQARGAGEQAKATARTNLAMSELDRMATKEKAVNDMINAALGTQYATGAQRDLTEMGIKNQRELSLADILSGNARTLYGGQANLYNSGAQRELAGAKPGIFDTLFPAVAGGFGKGFGGALGEKLGG